MKIDVIGTAAEVTLERVQGKVACVIDVFRATSVICTAMANGAKRFIPKTGIDESVALRDAMLSENPNAKVLLAGERHMVLIPGFDLDNSPLAFTRQKVEGATIIMSTTNGTRALNCAKGADAVYISSLLDATAVCTELAGLGKDIVLICSGRSNRFTLEDGFCAGKMVDILTKDNLLQPTDMAWMVKDMYLNHKHNLRGAMKNCQHYNRMMNSNLADDIDYCMCEDLLDYVVQFS